MIDFNDPAQTTHNGEHIAINTQAMYDAGLNMMKAMHSFYGVTMDKDAVQQYEQRVRNGQGLSEIQTQFGEDLVERYNVTLQ